MPGKSSRNAFLRVLGLGALGIMLVGMACAPAAPSPTAAPAKPAAPAPTAAPAAPAPTTAPAAPAPTTAPAAAPTAAPAAKPTEAAAPKPAAAAPTGRLVVAVGAWGTETPFFWNGAQNEKVLWDEIYDPLIMRDPKTFEYKPGLALEWKPSADYKSWTIKLRQGVQFHENWGELTSEDVKWTVEQNLRPETTGAEAPFIRTMLDNIQAPDKYTVVFNFKNPTWDLPPRIAQFTGYLNISSKKYVTSVGEQKAGLEPIGTGPYRHVEGKQGTEHRFEAVANHWRVTPAYKELVIRRVPDVATRLAGLRSGEIDIGQVFGDYMKQAKTANLRIHEVPASAEYWVVLPGQSLPELPDYCPKCPWVGEPDAKGQENAKKVRLALNLAVNKQAIVDGLWQGTGATSPFMYWYYPFNKGFDQNWKVPPYDPQKAKQLLAEAGYPNGFEIKVNPMLYTYAQDGPDVMEAIALDWEKIGLKVKRAPEDLGSFISKLRSGKTENRAWVYGSPPADEAAIVWQKTVWSKAGFHTVAESLDYDKDLEAIFAQLDTEKRAKQSHDFAQKMYDDYRTVMIGVKSTTWAVTKKVGDWPSLVSIPLETNYEYITP